MVALLDCCAALRAAFADSTAGWLQKFLDRPAQEQFRLLAH